MMSEHLVLLPCYQPQNEKKNILNNDYVNEIKQINLNSSNNKQQNKEFEREKLIMKYFLLQDNNNNYKLNLLIKSKWLLCFNRQTKITPDVFEDWMQILVRSTSSNSILILMHESDQVTHELKNQAIFWGITSNRLYFLPRLKSNDYKKLLQLSDLFLDTRNYGSHTVASDSMFEGTPVLTLGGFSFSSRVASSLNKADNIDIEMNCYNRKEYVNNGIKLISNYNIHNKKYNNLIDNINDKIFKSRHIDNTSILFNSLLFAKNIELITQSMYNVYLLYNTPFHIFLEESLNNNYLNNKK